MVAMLLKVPVSIISLVDTDRIWFKSHYGIEVQEVDRAPGLCASAILGDLPYIQNDARVDVRSLANPLVAGAMGLQFYAGVPLTTIKGFIQLLGTMDPNPHEKYTAILHDEVTRMEFIVNEFAMLARSEAASFKEHPLQPILVHTKALLENEAAAHDVTITVRFDQGIPNVLCDEGCGIPADRLKYLGEPYYDVKQKGTGMGLMVCCNIVQQHQGHISIESRLDEGTTVDVILPCLPHDSGSSMNPHDVM